MQAARRPPQSIRSLKASALLFIPNTEGEDYVLCLREIQKELLDEDHVFCARGDPLQYATSRSNKYCTRKTHCVFKRRVDLVNTIDFSAE